jgi:hypothetical protein
MQHITMNHLTFLPSVSDSELKLRQDRRGIDTPFNLSYQLLPVHFLEEGYTSIHFNRDTDLKFLMRPLKIAVEGCIGNPESERISLHPRLIFPSVMIP